MGLPVFPRADVEAKAMTWARQMTNRSRRSLVSLKQQWTQCVQRQLEETYRIEVAMHEETLVGQAEALARIQSSFYQHPEALPASIEQAPEEAAPSSGFSGISSSDSSDVLAAVSANL